MHSMRIPSEIKKFFEVEEGQTLLVKGLPGTGKTTLAFEILNTVCKKHNGMYISTRVDPRRVYAIFPWVRDVIPSRNVVNATQKLLIDSLKSINIEGSSYEVVLDFFKTLFEGTEDMNDPMIVIDSWDAVVNYTSYYLGDSQHSLEQNICEFAHDMGIHLIFVSESSKLMPLDYIVDGVVTLEQFRIMGPLNSSDESRPRGMMTRYAREIQLNKLRGVEIGQKAYTCTLHSGRFRYFEPCLEHINAQIISDAERIPDPVAGRISTGIPDLDKITGGLRYGSCNVLEIDHGVGKRYYPILTALASNAVKNGRAVHIVPSIGYQLSPTDIFVPSNVKVLEPGGDREEWCETLFSHWDQLRELTGCPILNVMGMDAMEFAFEYEKLLNMSTKLFQKWKVTNDINVVVVKSGQECIRMMTHIADIYIVITELCGGLCIYGLIPRTEPYYLSQDSHKNIHLIPIV